MTDADFTFPRSCRLKRQRDFDRIFGEKCSAADDWLIVYAHANALDVPRLGLSVSKRLGNAVVRNRLKRLLREAFRLSRKDLPAGYDFVCIPRHADGPDLDVYKTSLLKLTRAAVKRCRKKATS